MEDPWLERNAKTAAFLYTLSRGFTFAPTEDGLLSQYLIPHVLKSQASLFAPIFITENIEFHPSKIEELYPASQHLGSKGCYYFLINGGVLRKGMGYIWEPQGTKVAILSDSSIIGWRQDYVNRLEDGEKLYGWQMKMYEIESEYIEEDVKNTPWRLVKFIAPQQPVHFEPSEATIEARAARKARLGPDYI